MSQAKAGRRTRRQFPEEFKEGAIRLAPSAVLSPGQLASYWVM